MKNKKRRFLIILISFFVFSGSIALSGFITGSRASQVGGAIPPGLAVIHSAGCSGCHIINGKGGTMGPNLSTIGSALSIRGIKGALDLMVKHGYTSLTQRQISTVAGYLKTLTVTAPRIINKTSPVNMLRSAGCLGCHADTKYGMGVAPNLYAIGSILSSKGVETAVNYMSAAILARPLSQVDISTIATYLKSLKGTLPAVKKNNGLTIMQSAGCLGCHATTGRGISIGPDLLTVGSTLNSFGINTIVDYMNNNMIARPLSPNDVSIVEDYMVRKLNKKPPAYEKAGTPLELTKRTCLGCHTLNGYRGTANGTNHGPAFNFSVFMGKESIGWWWGAINMDNKFFLNHLTATQVSEILNYLSSKSQIVNY